ncbi:MAG: hypothetical protein HY591_05380 [Candidatus Omnitrophica bacterium]|nr:hypothetical protein [Candidatus Omnitrophota bacterium]
MKLPAHIKAAKLSWVAFFLVLAHMAVFLYLNTRPIYWTHQEMLWHGFFWSMDDADRLTLHQGLYWKDFLKPFYPFYVEAIFRARQVSYVADMLFFKFWQMFGQVLLRNYTLVLLHALNVFLVWKITFHLTRQKNAAWLAALMLLNSGVALATLMFPFRSAKLLVMTLFLTAWFMAARGTFLQRPLTYRLCFYAVTVLALLTDENSYFFMPFVFLSIGIRDGFKNILRPRFFIETALTLAVFGLSVAGIYFLVLALPQQYLAWGIVGDALRHLWVYWQTPGAVFSDLGKAFFGHFLRRDFGYWDLSLWGILAAISALGLLVAGIWERSWSRQQIWVMASLTCLIAVKAFLLPHNSGVHTPPLMPQGTVFPSLFFFSYYYTYGEAVLFALIAGLFLNGALAKHRAMPAAALVLSLFIGLSSAIHLKDGPEDTLRYHLLWEPHRQRIVKNVLDLEKFLARKNDLPVYVSFKSGDYPLARGRLSEHPLIPSRYCQYVLLRYLRDIEAGRVIISLKNARPLKPLPYPDELSNARFFLDMATGQTCDLQAVRQKYGLEGMSPNIVTKPGMKSLLVTDPQAKEVIFFIKGRAQFFLEANNTHRATGEQTYGQAYEMVRLSFKDAGLQAPITINLLIAPQQGQTVELAGPFVM